MTEIQKVKYKGMAVGTLAGILLSLFTVFAGILIGSTKIAVAVTAKVAQIDSRLDQHDKDILSLQNKTK